MKKFNRILLFLLVAFVFAACSKNKNVEKVGDIEYTVVADENVPREFAKQIEEKKEKGFKLTFLDEKYLYIATGFGTQKTGGYSIAIDQLYLAKNAILFDTNLIGPGDEDSTAEAETYPYIVVKMEKTDIPVVFQ